MSTSALSITEREERIAAVFANAANAGAVFELLRRPTVLRPNPKAVELRTLIVLKMSGLPRRAKATSCVSTQDAASIVIDTATTARGN